MPGLVRWTYRDRSLEDAIEKIPIPNIDAASYVATMAAINAYQTAWDAAIVGMGTRVRREIIALRTYGTGGPPTSKWAQRELKWLVSYSDTVTNKRYSVEIPCADMTLVTVGTDKLDLIESPGNEFAGAFNNFVRSPAGNAVQVVEVRLVGRSI